MVFTKRFGHIQSKNKDAKLAVKNQKCDQFLECRTMFLTSKQLEIAGPLPVVFAKNFNNQEMIRKEGHDRHVCSLIQYRRKLKQRNIHVTCCENPTTLRNIHVTCCENPPTLRNIHVTCYENPTTLRNIHVTCYETPTTLRNIHVTCCENPHHTEEYTCDLL